MTNLANFKSTIESTWEAVTPASDGTSDTYSFVDSDIAERGFGRHRELVWRPGSFEIVGEESLQLQWDIPCELFIHRNDRDYDDFIEAAEAEIVDLIISYSSITSWGAGVLEVVLQDVQSVDDEPERPDRAGGVPTTEVLVWALNFQVLTEET